MSKIKTITLTEKGIDSGPYYEVSCSVDCITYTNCLTASVYLPTVGSSVNITIDDNVNCIKLIDNNGICNNSLIFVVGTTTTSTTTTTQPPTTTTTTGGTTTTTTAGPTTTTTTSGETTTTTTSTTTTTQPPTTTTTTQFCAGAQCKNWQYNNVPSGGDTITYYSCATGNTQSLSVGEGDTGTFCNCNTVNNPSALNGTQLTEIGTC